MSLALLQRFAAAWNAHDLDALLLMVIDDCDFDTAAGAHGNRFVGKQALRAAFPAAWQTWPDARWEEATHFVCGQRGVSAWTFRGTDRRFRP